MRDDIPGRWNMTTSDQQSEGTSKRWGESSRYINSDKINVNKKFNSRICEDVKMRKIKII